MQIEELYKLRQKVIENKDSFSKLNKKYNELLRKKHEKSLNEKKVLDDELIKKYGYNLYCIRFMIAMILLNLFSTPMSFYIFFVFINLFLRTFDEKVLLPKLIKRRKNKRITRTEEEVYQDELYEEVSKARTLFHELNNEYERQFQYLSKEEKGEYQEYLRILGFDLELENNRDVPIIESSTEAKLLNKAYCE